MLGALGNQGAATFVDSAKGRSEPLEVIIDLQSEQWIELGGELGCSHKGYLCVSLSGLNLQERL